MRLLNAPLMENLTETTGTIFKIKRFSVHDGPGIRTSVFLKGCPLNCIWCHSPEGIDSDISIWYEKSLCIHCGECVRSCPNDALKQTPDPYPFIKIDRNKCSLAGECLKVCPTGAIQFTGSKVSAKEILEEVEKDLLYYHMSGGGVTLTGGEPLYQPDFSMSVLDLCHKKNIHTAIETCLFCERDIIEKIKNYVDLFIVDVKIYDRDQHIRYTGRSNELIKENLKHVARSGKFVIVRIPLIPGISDNAENINACQQYVNEIDTNIPVEFVSYNSLAENNYNRLGIPFLL
jgi:pyruvate formate lyase activating enzyme